MVMRTLLYLNLLFALMMPLPGRAQSCPAAGTNQPAAAKWNAKISTSATFAGRQYVRVDFPASRPVIEIQDTSHYRLYVSNDLAQQLIGIVQARPLNGDTNIAPNGKVGAKAKSVLLTTDIPLHSDIVYTIQARFDDTNSPLLNFPSTNEAPATQKSGTNQSSGIAQMFSAAVEKALGNQASFTLTPRTPFDSKSGLAVDFNLKYPRNPSDLSLLSGISSAGDFMYTTVPEFVASGTVGTITKNTNINEHLDFSLNFTGIGTYACGTLPECLGGSSLALPNGQSWRLPNYYSAGLRLKAMDVESDQHFDVVNYTLKPQAFLQVPFSDYPGLWWANHFPFGNKITNNVINSVYLYFGYTKVVPIHSDTNTVTASKQGSDRAEGELTYAIPLSQQLTLDFHGRLFWLLNTHSTQTYWDVSGEYAFDPKKSIVLEYAQGVVPPTFQKGNAVSAGFSLKF